MRLLLTAPRYAPDADDVDPVAALAPRLAASGHAVTVATAAHGDAPREEERDGVHVRRFAPRGVLGVRVASDAYRGFVTSPEWDVVHVHGARVWTTDGLLRRFRGMPAPVVFTGHGFPSYHTARTRLVDDWYHHIILPRVLRHAAAVTAATEEERRELVSWGVRPERVHVVPGAAGADAVAKANEALYEEVRRA